jgi:hypothetical protein
MKLMKSQVLKIMKMQAQILNYAPHYLLEQKIKIHVMN